MERKEKEESGRDGFFTRDDTSNQYRNTYDMVKLLLLLWSPFPTPPKREGEDDPRLLQTYCCSSSSVISRVWPSVDNETVCMGKSTELPSLSMILGQ